MKVRLTPAIIATRRFPPDRLDALYLAVQVDDTVDAETPLPDRITLDHPQALLADAYLLCRQLWVEDAGSAELPTLLDRLGRDGDLDAEDRARFKHVRAKLKQFRFAQALYRADHRYPPVTDWLTTALGHLQDAFRTGQHRRLRRKLAVTRALLSPGPAALMRRERDRLCLSDSDGLRAYVSGEVAGLGAVMDRATVTGHQFHATRKIASRQVAFYNAMGTLRPDCLEFARMGRSLAAINGLMGELHDRLIDRRVAGVQDYHREGFPLPDAIRDRIAALVDRYRASGVALPVRP